MEHQVKYSEEMISVLRYKINSRLIKALSNPQKDHLLLSNNCIPGLNSRIFRGKRKYPAHIKVKLIMPHIQ